MLPKPVKTFDTKPDNRFRAFMLTRQLDSLTDEEKKIYPELCRMLQSKVDRGETEINIVKLVQYYGILTEILCRRLINKFEWDYGKHKYEFTIILGHEQFKEADQVRIASIQKRCGGENKIP